MFEFSLLFLIAAVGGGIFGAAIGGLPAFVFTGFAVIAGVAAAISGAEYDFLTNVAFGPVFGPHIAFGGAVAAAAYAKRAGMLDNGKDITFGLAGLGNPVVLLVGGAFGALGYVLVTLLTPLVGSYTDAIALVVAISAFIARLVFGSSGLLGNLEPAAETRGRFVPGDTQVWVPHQEGWGQASVIGLGVGALSTFMFLGIYEVNPELATPGAVLGFGISAASLIFLQYGTTVPVTHHMALVAGYAALVTVPIIGPTGALFVGLIGGVIGALLGELFSRLFLIHGDTHIDPPANAIWVGAAIFFVGGLLFA
ncbi:MAG: hypothetical protein M3494_17525 [Actinomycetota bacterium]|nr:hypothetical protein [Actinomycetota bacterium]